MIKKFSKRSKILVSLVAMILMMSTLAISVSASWYGFTHNFHLPQEKETTVFEGEYDGNNVGADIWINWDTIYGKPDNPIIEFSIQKKVWYGWKTVAVEHQSINNQCTVKAWNVGSGRYRFRVYNGFTYGDMYATKFESYSWE